MTFSIAAHCPLTGMFAIAVASSSPAVAARCAHARAGVGVVATQNITDPTLGPKGLDAMASGLSASEALAKLVAGTPHAAYRQLMLVDAKGRTATYSGANTLGVHAMSEGVNAAAAGNLLASKAVPNAMIIAWLKSPEAHIGDRVIAAMKAALLAGGEVGPIHSAGMLIVRDVAWPVSWPVADLRVDWHDTDPVGELAALWGRWKPEMDAYVTRALNPGGAPSYGVPGDV